LGRGACPCPCGVPTVGARKGIMEIRNVTPAQFEQVVGEISRRMYSGNVVCEWLRGRYQLTPTLLRADGTAFRGRVVVRDSRSPGARRSWSGRRMPAACWHAFRDVVRATLREYPQAIVKTSMARYTYANFEDVYPGTGERNVGSLFQPAYMPDLCDCDHEGDPALGSPMDAAVARIDAANAIEPGRCGWCNASTMGAAAVWCSQVCQESWQAKYPLGV